ncbi:Nucleolar complex protein 3 [Merluccius polli]|uniref:Nucleolar complex protein 3 homolog n=1 Tax=Merluccius polli TaxID=89951 RepID=A0AA47N069_MERPO|nr:Nucleolar complex protein 3 [Merluccius polli]
MIFTTSLQCVVESDRLAARWRCPHSVTRKSLYFRFRITLRKDSAAARRSWDAAETFRSGPPKSKKRKPSFRRLLKTSSVKIENKTKNRRFKQENADKKHRKEKKKLRSALKDSSIRTARPLEVYKKNPEEELEEDEDDDFLETLPTDMIEEEDLEQMKAMARKASFVTRDLSASEPVYSKKRKGGQSTESYEKLPRKMRKEEQKEVIHLLPIKDKSRLIPQSMEKPVIQKEEDENEEEDAEMELSEKDEDEEQEAVPLTAEERETLRAQKLTEKKLRIAMLGSAIISDPNNNVKKLKELRGMLVETDSYVAVTVRKLVMVSLMEVFKDIAPAYRIRPLTEEEKDAKVRRETQQLREFEEGLISQYKFYLENLEQTIKDWKQKKLKRSQAVALPAYRGLAEVAVRCVCELLVALPHFNFHNNIIVVLVPLMNDSSKKVSDMCCEAMKTLFKEDKLGYASLAAVKVLSGMIKGRHFNVRPEVLKTLMSLRIREVDLKRDTEDTAPKKRFLNNKEKRKSLSRMQRKWKKAEEKLEKELLEAEASENKDKKVKLHTETLNIVFLIYFRILKKAQKSVLLPAVLEGLAKFAHLINLEFFDDLLNVLQNLIRTGDLTTRESLHCIQTAFNILSGQGDVLNIDPLKFYTHLYKTLIGLHAGAPNDDIIIVLQCLDVMLTKRRKQVTLQRAMAFVKRLCTLCLHVLPNASIGIMAANRAVIHAFPKCDLLLDSESQGSGVFLPELDEPEYCNPQNTSLWELHTLMRHYQPVVRKFASHLSHGAPSEGSGALGVNLSRRSPGQLFEDYSFRDMTFNPPVGAPTTKKRDYFTIGPALLDQQLKKQVDKALSVAAAADDASLDFSQALTQTST